MPHWEQRDTIAVVGDRVGGGVEGSVGGCVRGGIIDALCTHATHLGGTPPRVLQHVRNYPTDADWAGMHDTARNHTNCVLQNPRGHVRRAL